jgi:hypothetical protein
MAAAVRDDGPHGYVYFLLGYRSGKIKIGYAADFRARISSVRCHSPETLVLLGVIECDGAKERERQIHEQFTERRCHGEWFAPDYDLLRFIAEHTEFHYDDHWEITDIGAVVTAMRPEPTDGWRRDTSPNPC